MNEFDELASPEEQARHAAQPVSPMQAPHPSAAEHSAKHTRRVFLFKLSLGLNAVVGAVLAVPLLGYILAPLFRRSASYNSWVPLLKVDSMPVGATRLAEYTQPLTSPTDGITDKIPCWARRLSASTYEVFAINCAHLGCPVHWFEESQLFLCPCHGGAYYANGARAAGPPPRGLFKYDVRTSGDTVFISAGELPTLSNHACNGAPKRDLIQIAPVITGNLVEGRDA